MRRRDFLISGTGLVGAGLALACGEGSRTRDVQASHPSTDRPAGTDPSNLFQISLAQWSLNRALNSGRMDNLDFAASAKNDFGVDAVEYVNQFFFEKAADKVYLAEMKNRAEGEGVRSLLIMCDRLGNLGSPDDSTRKKAVESHYAWVEAAKYLGCHSIRVNALLNSEARAYDEQMNLSAEGLRALAEFADTFEMNVIVENHGSWSSNGAWLAAVMAKVDHTRCGTLPDFGNFCIRRAPGPDGGCEESYDKYRGVQELMPYAKAVSAKSHQFDEKGNEVEIDFERMMRIVLDAGYRGYVGVEYEGRSHSEPDGIRATIALLGRVRERLGPVYTNS